MTTMIFRSVKGSNLTPNEVDTNFFNTKTDIEAIQAQLLSFAPKASPTFTGIPSAPTAAAGTNTTQLATMAAIVNERTTTRTFTNAAISGASNTLTSLPANQILGIIPVANLGTGATGSNFLRGDGTFQTIPGGGDALTSGTLGQFAATTSLQLKNVISDESGKCPLLFGTSPSIASPTFSGTVAGTFTMPVGATLASTPAPSDNSTKLASTGYVDAGLALKVTANAAASITGSNTLTSASHFNRHLDWTGASAATQTISGTANAGDFIECANSGSAILTFAGATAAPGYRLSINPGETFYAAYTNGAWVSLMSIPVYQSVINSQSANYTLVAADAGATIYHPSTDGTPRTWTIPANSATAFPIGTIITIDNDVGAGLSIVITTDTLVMVGAAGATGTRTLAAGGRAVIQKVAATRWRIGGTAELT